VLVSPAWEGVRHHAAARLAVPSGPRPARASPDAARRWRSKSATPARRPTPPCARLRRRWSGRRSRRARAHTVRSNVRAVPS